MVNSRYKSDYRVTQTIDFDIAVTTSEDDKVNAGVGIFVGPVGLGTKASLENVNTSLNRMKFSVPVLLPQQK